MDSMELIFWFSFCSVIYHLGNCSNLIDISEDVFSSKNVGSVSLAAFGDYNSDKLTDLFVLIQNGKGLQIFLADERIPYLRQSTIKCNIDQGAITGVAPADFNGDSQMDVLITIDVGSEQEFRILWGAEDSLNCSSSSSTSVKNVVGQPFILDFNGDKIPDLLGEVKVGSERQRTVWFISQEGLITSVNISQGSGHPFRHPHSNTFTDLNGDMTADLMITTDKGFEVWYSQKNGELTYQPSASYENPEKVSLIGQSAILDVDLDGVMNPLLPVCVNSDCSESAIMIRRNDKWLQLNITFQNSNVKWGFVAPKSAKDEAIHLRVGDVDLDGYPDLMVILKSFAETPVTRAYFLQNVACEGCEFSRTFSVLWDSGFSDINDASAAAFYDIFNNGILDILLSRRTVDGNTVLKAFQNNYDNNACFIKVIVLSGLCYTDCPHKKVPYGVNQPGPFICYKTTTPEGNPQSSCAGQLTQSAHFSLQLPYVVFGLGHTPNFVDTLQIGVPSSDNLITSNHHWTSIIPNSQMFVIPQLATDSYRWINKLFVTPSHLVLITFAALMGFMGLILFIILGLHWKERQEDKKEKLQEAHRFHFDAM